MQEKICIHCFVSGRVQGVFFRASTQEKAEELGVTGWVRNLADGRVELLACGELSVINELKQWLQKGPAGAEVSEVICNNHHFEDHTKFVITANSG